MRRRRRRHDRIFNSRGGRTGPRIHPWRPGKQEFLGWRAQRFRHAPPSHCSRFAGAWRVGVNRKKWGIPEFGADVFSVIGTEGAKRVVLFGNSLGGPVAIEAALLLPDRVLGVVGVDTFQSLTYTLTAEDAQKRADAFRNDHGTSLRQMVTQLFHSEPTPHSWP